MEIQRQKIFLPRLDEVCYPGTELLFGSQIPSEIFYCVEFVEHNMEGDLIENMDEAFPEVPEVKRNDPLTPIATATL